MFLIKIPACESPENQPEKFVCVETDLDVLEIIKLFSVFDTGRFDPPDLNIFQLNIDFLFNAYPICKNEVNSPYTGPSAHRYGRFVRRLLQLVRQGQS